ncbi:hypothetical protein RJ639_005744 [Escallonia herrerae]|uniref:Toprim domain-containing protein n=1 Tax=Escallonia herrerae TaxID=1293975 RepID=A0AA89AU30_9ASTE|nr:hypothetical protein RJ639_005744 [Escallonia herrerae]
MLLPRPPLLHKRLIGQNVGFMACKHSLFTRLPPPPSRASIHLLHTYRPVSSAVKKPISESTSPVAQKTSGFSSFSHPSIPRPVHLENPKEAMKQRLVDMGIRSHSWEPGQYDHLLCPMCKGGDNEEKSLSLFIAKEGLAVYNCFRAKCGWKGSTQGVADVKSSYKRMNQITQAKPQRIITEQELGLQPLCNEVLAYFAERMISGETLRRNAVMQRTYGDQIVIAFPYRRHGGLVSCKYRDINKKFWQENDTEKIFYGLDDIEGASDIIIVEGEIDKLSMEEAGFRNCVSVPDGAPPSVSTKDLPSEIEDKKYRYLWNCKAYLEKASRIILATDGDPPGQALAEELARRLGRERCWRVRWPEKGETGRFKDANEVLMYLGPRELRQVIENAELYPIQGLFNFSDYLSEIDGYYYQTLGYELGVSTGWKNLDEFYNEQMQDPLLQAQLSPSALFQQLQWIK